MRNLVECNIVIPQIITIADEKERESFIQQFVIDYRIDISHVIILKPEKAELTIDQIRQLQRDVYVSFEKEVLIVLYDLDNSGLEVQNSLLKIFEEQGERLSFLLLIRDSARLLPTIISRCTVIASSPSLYSQEVKNIDIDIVDYFSFVKNSDVTKEEAIARIDYTLQSHTLKNSKILKHLLTVRKLIMENNMNPLLALDSILLFLTKQGTMKVPNAKTK